MKKFLLSAFFGFFVITTTLLVVFSYNWNVQEKIFFIDPNENLGSILKRMHKENIIKSQFFTKSIIILLKKQKLLKAGEYIVKPRENIFSIIDKMIKRDSVIRKIKIPDGATSHVIISILQNTDGIFGKLDESSIREGELLPNTYHFQYGDNINIIVSLMRDEFSRLLKKLWQERDSTSPSPLDNIKDVVILASIIEKEVGSGSDKLEEKAEVAGIFINRLKRKMKLQSDCTVEYAITGGRGVLRRLLTIKDLKTPLPHNTYYTNALPPTPIANPGKESIQAALNPKKTDNLFFISDNQGNIFFSKTFEEHSKIKKRIKRENKMLAKQ